MFKYRILMMGALCGLRSPEEDFGGGGGGGAAMAEKEFQDKVISKVASTEEKLDAFQKENKKHFDELTEMKNQYAQTQQDMQSVTEQLQKLALKQTAYNRRENGDPIQRIIDSEEKCNLINAHIRKAVGAPLAERHEKALNSTTGAGSTLIDDQLHTDIYDTLNSYGIWSTFDVRTVTKKTNKFLVKTARPIAKFFGEGITITEDNNKAGVSKTKTAKGIKVLLTVPNELLEDSEIDLSADILRDFIEAVAYRIDWMCLQADGTDDEIDGGFTGIFAGGTSSVAGAGRTSVEALTLEDVTGTMLATDEAVMQRNACWWIHPHMLVRLLHIKDGNGRPIFLTATESPSPGAIGSILGYPVKLSPAAPNDNSAGKPVAAFGDPRGLVVGVRKGFEFRESKEANFADDETVFRGIARAGCAVRSAAAFGILTLAA